MAKSGRECGSKNMKKKRGPWSLHINICGSGKMVAKLQTRKRLLIINMLIIISVIPAINAEKKISERICDIWLKIKPKII